MNQDLFLTSSYGVKMPPIIYGTAWKKQHTSSLVELAIKTGFRGIDTACQPKHYNEAGVGAGLAACLDSGIKRSELYIQSKFTPLSGQDPLQIPYDKLASLSKQVAQSFKMSLLNLQISYLDSLVLHSPLSDPKQFMEVWCAMELIFEEEGVKQLGISNCYDVKQLEWLYQSAKIKPAVLQNRFYADTDYDRDVRDFCRQHDIIYQSFWTLTANPHLLASETMINLGRKYHRTPEQILYHYLNKIGIVPLTGTCSLQHMQDDLAIFEFNLDLSECTELEQLL